MRPAYTGCMPVVRVLILLICAAVPFLAAAEVQRLPILAKVGPWPVASYPIRFRGRLWFVNSVKGIDHNSGDVYSLGPNERQARHERHLWSQDAGAPTIHQGQLYWPSEDSRLFGDWGEFQITNGKGWRTGAIPFGGIFHIHAMAAKGQRLYAATSAWQGGVYVSNDRGRTWRNLYLHPRSETGFSRIVTLLPTNRGVVGLIRDRGVDGVIVVDADGTSRRLTDWPTNGTQEPLSHFQGKLHALVQGDDGLELWRENDGAARRVHRFRSGQRLFSLRSYQDALWALSNRPSGGTVWRSADGRNWRPVARFAGGQGRNLLVGKDLLIVTGGGLHGHGIVWGRFLSVDTKDPALPLPDLTNPLSDNAPDWSDEAEILAAHLRDPSAYDRVGRSLRDHIFPLARSRPPIDFFPRLLNCPRPDGRLNPFRDVIVPDKGSIGAFWLLWGMGMAQTGRVPPDMIRTPWSVPANSAEKYFEPQPMAMWAAAELGQVDRDTLDALMARALNTDDPLRLRMDAIGALTALTGLRHGADFAAWQRWWDDR